MDKEARVPGGAGSARRNVVLGNNTERRNKPPLRLPQALVTDIDSRAALRAESAARDQRLREGAQIHARGERVTAEFIEAAHPGAVDLAEFDRLRARFANVDPDLLRAFGGDRLPPPPPLRPIEDER